MSRPPDSNLPPAYLVEARALLLRATETLRRAVQAVPAGERYGALLLGPTGAGKSSAAAWAARRWQAHWATEHPPTGIYYPDDEFCRVAWLDALEATDAERRYRLGTGDPADLALAYDAEWLVLDDVGLSSSVSLIQLVLARRYAATLPTIVTSGLTAEQFTAHIGAPTVRRIVEYQGRPGLFVDCHAQAAA